MKKSKLYGADRYTRTKRKVAILGSELGPRYNEAFAKKMKILSDALDYDVYTVNERIGKKVFLSLGRYHVINGWLAYKDIPLLSQMWKLIVGLYFLYVARRHDLVMLSGGMSSPLVNVVPLSKTLIYVASPPDEDNDTDILAKAYSEARGFIVESARCVEFLKEQGVREERILPIGPLMDLPETRAPPPLGPPFRILFASAPRKTIARRENYVERGVPMLLDAISLLRSKWNVTLTMLWREDYHKRVTREIEERNIGEYVDVVPEVVDTSSYLATHHLVVIPFLSSKGMPDYPLSALESLEHGRPVVSTPLPPLSELIASTGCGKVSESINAEDFFQAMDACLQNYDTIMGSCKTGEVATKTLEDITRIEAFVNSI